MFPVENVAWTIKNQEELEEAEKTFDLSCLIALFPKKYLKDNKKFKSSFKSRGVSLSETPLLFTECKEFADNIFYRILIKYTLRVRMPARLHQAS